MNHEDLRDVLHPIERHLDRIANALEVVAADINRRNEHDREVAVKEYARLAAECQRADGEFEAVESRFDGNNDQRRIQSLIEQSRRAEDRCRDAYNNMEAFMVAHPGLPDTSVSGYSFGPEPPFPAPEGYVCQICGCPEEGPHLSPCVVDDHDLELLAAEALDREEIDDIIGYDPLDAVVGFERLAIHSW